MACARSINNLVSMKLNVLVAEGYKRMCNEAGSKGTRKGLPAAFLATHFFVEQTLAEHSIVVFYGQVVLM